MAGGLFVSLFGVFAPVEQPVAFVLFGTLFFGVPFVLGGLLIWGVHERLAFMHRVHGVSWPELFCGIIAVLIGSLIVLVSFGDSRDAAFHAPRWAVAAAGGCFVLVGIAVIWVAVAGRWPRTSDVMMWLTGAVFFTGLAVVGWAVVVYGEGMSMIGSIAVAIGALATTAYAVFVWIGVVKRMSRAWKP